MDKSNLISHIQGVHMTSAEIGKATGDVSGLLVLGLAFMEIVPSAAAIFTMIWMFFRMIETGTRVYRMIFVEPHNRREEDKEEK